MNILLFVIIIALYFPMFGKIIPITADLPYNFANYSIVFLLMIYIISKIFINEKTIKFIGIGALLFGFYYISNLWLKGIFFGYVQEFSAKAAGVTIGSLFLLSLNQFNVSNRPREFFNKLIIILGIFLCLQVILSFIESRLGYTLGRYEIRVYSAGAITNEFSLFGSRDILLIFNTSLENLLGLHFPFTGLIGQHNAFGTMLVFYNLIFILHYLEFRSKISIFFMVVVILAIIGNTTRIAMLLIIISDILLIYKVVLKKTVVKIMVTLIFILSSIWIISILYGQLIFYLQNSNTIYSRLIIWNSISRNLLSSESVFAFIIGIDPKLLLSGSFAFTGGFLYSLENQYISLLLFSGLAGLFLYLYIFIISPIKKSFYFIVVKSFIIKLLAFLILILSLTLDNILHYSSYSLIVLILFYCFLPDAMADNNTISKIK